VIPEFQKNDWQVPKLLDKFEDICNQKNFKGEKPIAVLVSTPNSFHFNQAKIAIESGYHVYVERPIVTIQDNLPALVKLADQHQVLLCTGLQRR
jgi:predicted dehydrogenase